MVYVEPAGTQSQKVGRTAIEEDEDKRLVHLELDCEADGVASPDPV